MTSGHSDHDVYRHVDALSQAMAQDKRPLALLLGAGCPLSVPDPDNLEAPLIPDIAGVTRSVVSEMVREGSRLSEPFQALQRGLIDDGHAEPNIEQMLSRARSLSEVVGSGDGLVRNLSRDQLDALDAAICAIIEQVVNRALPDGPSAYSDLATWIGSTTREFPIEIFTPNYDLLLEQALERLRIPYFDGFSGSHEPFFDLRALETDSLPTRWACLWTQQPTEDARRMIHPSHLKFDQSG